MATNKQQPVRVTVLTKSQCAFCEQAQELLQRLRDEYPLVIETVNIDSAVGETMASHGGILFPPGIFLDGEPFTYGRVSERKLRRELDRRISASKPRATWAADAAFWPELAKRNRRSIR
jgi:glutaredoxin